MTKGTKAPLQRSKCMAKAENTQLYGLFVYGCLMVNWGVGVSVLPCFYFKMGFSIHRKEPFSSTSFP